MFSGKSNCHFNAKQFAENDSELNTVKLKDNRTNSTDTGSTTATITTTTTITATAAAAAFNPS